MHSESARGDDGRFGDSDRCFVNLVTNESRANVAASITFLKNCTCCADERGSFVAGDEIRPPFAKPAMPVAKQLIMIS